MRYRKKIELFNWYVRLIAAFRNAKWQSFHSLLFSRVAEGWWFVVYGADFSNAILYRFPGRFLSFERCEFRDSNLISADFFPARFISCDMRGIDLRHANGYAELVNCDLRGAIFDQKTIFNPAERTEIPSKFINCNLDPDFKQLLEKQGVEVRGRYGEPDIFNKLEVADNLVLEEKILKDYLKNQLQSLRLQKRREEVAYNIAGLLSTKTARQLPENSLLMQLLYLAGELELPEKHRSKDATWEQFFRLSEKL